MDSDNSMLRVKIHGPSTHYFVQTYTHIQQNKLVIANFLKCFDTCRLRGPTNKSLQQTKAYYYEKIFSYILWI